MTTASSAAASPPPSVLDGALKYASRRLAVIPLHGVTHDNGKPVCSCPKGPACPSPGKHPRLSSWQDQASSDDVDVRHWWSLWPDANVGLALGGVRRWLALDIDADKGGFESLAALEATHGALPPTLTSRTGSGGRHFIFAVPADLELPGNRQAMRPGIDVRCTGGQIVAPPSLHASGRRYAWTGDVNRAVQIPPWLYALITRADAPTRPPAPAATFDGQLSRRASKALEEEVAKVGNCQPGGGGGAPGRDTQLLSSAAQLGEVIAGGSLPADMVRSRLLEAAFACGLTSEKDIERQIDRGFEKGAANPRPLPDEYPLRKRTGAPGRIVTAEVAAPSDSGAISDDGDNGDVIDDDRPELASAPPSAAAASHLPAEWAGAPVADGTRLPNGYLFDDGRLLREIARATASGDISIRHELVAPCALVIVGRLRDVRSGRESTRIAWRREGWHHQVVDRAVVANARKLVDLAGYGLPVNSTTARAQVDYLSAFEASNIQNLPRADMSAQMGWQQGYTSFLWGHRLITADAVGPAVVLDEVAPEEWGGAGLAFRGADVGDEQLARGCELGGTMEGWLAAARELAQYPVAAMAIYASLASCLLEVVDANNFVVDWCYTTSSGKTTALRLAASVWGNPNERAGAAFVHGWDENRVWIERAAAVLTGMPLILDDTKRAKTPRMVAQTVYDVQSGRGRGRGSLEGLRATSTWRTVLLSTGEDPITSFSEDGGTRARALPLWAQVFGQKDAATGEFVQRLDLEVRTHYGHAGPAFVRWLLSIRDQWGERWEGLRDAHRELRSRYVDKAGGDAVKGRLAEYMATLEIAALCAEEAFGLELDCNEHFRRLWGLCTSEAAEADRASVALAHVLSWAHSNKDTFHGRASRSPARGWSGKWEGKDLLFFPSVLDEVLTAAGHNVTAMRRLWAERGWIESSKGYQGQVQRRIDGTRAWVVSICEEARAALGFGGEDDSPV